jgi:hypothetical protein
MARFIRHDEDGSLDSAQQQARFLISVPSDASVLHQEKGLKRLKKKEILIKLIINKSLPVAKSKRKPH